MVVRSTFPALRSRASEIIDRQSYAFFYDDVAQQMSHGYYVNVPTRSEYHYGLLYTEPRLGSLIAETPDFKGQALLALTDGEVALVKLKQGAISAKPTEVIARAPRGDVTDATLANGLVPKLSITFSDGSVWSMDVPRVVKKQGDTGRIVELLGS